MGFSINSISAGAGHIAICPMPGRSAPYGDDFARITKWAPELVLSMATSQELGHFKASDLPNDLMKIGCDWLHLPVIDFGVPKQATWAKWPDASDNARQVLMASGRVLVHCKGGCGRSGMAILRILVEMGEPPEIALARLRTVRPCAVETHAQYTWAVHTGK